MPRKANMTNRHKKFRDRAGFSFKMRHSQKVIDFAVFLANQHDPAFSSRDISQRILDKFSLHVSHVTVSKMDIPVAHATGQCF